MHAAIRVVVAVVGITVDLAIGNLAQHLERKILIVDGIDDGRDHWPVAVWCQWIISHSYWIPPRQYDGAYASIQFFEMMGMRCRSWRLIQPTYLMLHVQTLRSEPGIHRTNLLL